MPGALGGAPLGQTPLGRHALGVFPAPLVLLRQVAASKPGSLILPEDCLVDIFARGAGGGGASVGSGVNGGGGGGAAGYSRLLLGARWTLSWTAGAGGYSVGNPGFDVAGVAGADTTVSINGAIHGTAQGGRAGGGANSGAIAGRSVATGFQINRYGGGANEAGEFGGAGGGSPGSGGGSGGFLDLFGASDAGDGAPPGFLPGGVPSVAQPGGGGGSGNNQAYSGYGGHGLVTINIYRLA